MEFNVVQDVFMTPTAMGLCDLFLPVTTFAEHDGMVLSPLRPEHPHGHGHEQVRGSGRLPL